MKSFNSLRMKKKTFEILETKNEFHADFKYENSILTKKE